MLNRLFGSVNTCCLVIAKSVLICFSTACLWRLSSVSPPNCPSLSLSPHSTNTSSFGLSVHAQHMPGRHIPSSCVCVCVEMHSGAQFARHITKRKTAATVQFVCTRLVWNCRLFAVSQPWLGDSFFSLSLSLCVVMVGVPCGLCAVLFSFTQPRTVPPQSVILEPGLSRNPHWHTPYSFRRKHAFLFFFLQNMFHPGVSSWERDRWKSMFLPPSPSQIRLIDPETKPFTLEKL